MPDPYSGGTGSTKQEVNIFKQAEELKRARVFTSEEEDSDDKGKRGKKKKEPLRVSELYNRGVSLLKAKGFILDLVEGAPHVNHKILKPSPPPEVKGIRYPHSFMPLQEISEMDDFEAIEKVFFPGFCDEETRNFWEPLYKPKAGESDLSSFTMRLLKMQKITQAKNFNKEFDFGHSFDPAARWGGTPALNPRIWVPDKDWFDPVLHEVKFSDVFTIFPEAELEILKLIIGRIGVGRSKHLPPGKDKVVDHTARMAGVIVGKDPGLGKSECFNGMTAAFSRCGFTVSTLKSTEERFGAKNYAMSDIAYKDDTSLSSLKKLLSAEETKIIITNGLLQVEDKFQSPELIWPKTVLLLNSNDWNSKFAYDLDPGIIDRIKLISTYREYEVNKNRNNLKGTVSDGTPDLRPKSHIPYLEEKLGVSKDALYLWCLRLCTDRFWEIINDNSDPTINRLQVEVRYWTTRQRIRFKADVTQALVNAMAFAHFVRTGCQIKKMPELTPDVLYDYLESLYFVGVDPSCQELTPVMKENWCKVGRPSTHYYQGFRELRWESVSKSISLGREMLFDEVSGARKETKDKTSLVIIKEMIEKLVLRDGFKIGGEASYIIENWENCRYAQEDLLREASDLLEQIPQVYKDRIIDPKAKCQDKWLRSNGYSPDTAENFRRIACEKMFESTGVKV